MITLTVRKATAESGLGKTKLYALMRDGHLESVRVGRRRLVKADSLRALLEKGVA